MGPQNLKNYYFNRLDAKLDYTSYYDFFLVADERDINTEVLYSKNIIGYDDCEVLPVWIDLGNPSSSLQLTMECGTFYPNNTILSISGTCWCHATPSAKDLDCIDCGVDCYTSGCTEMGGFITSICDIGLTGMDNGWTNSLKRNADKVEICWSGCGYPYYWELSPDTQLLNADNCECSLSEVTDIYTGHFSAGTCWESSGFTWSPNTNIPDWIKSKIENDYNYGTGIYTFSTSIQKTNQDCGGFIKTSYTVFVSEPECLCCPPIIDDEPCETTTSTTTIPEPTTTTTTYTAPTTTTTTIPVPTTTTTTCNPPVCYGISDCNANAWFLSLIRPCASPLLVDGGYYSFSGLTNGTYDPNGSLTYSGCYRTTVEPCVPDVSTLRIIDGNTLSNQFINCATCNQ